MLPVSLPDPEPPEDPDEPEDPDDPELELPEPREALPPDA
jgi:hypothetical protein